MVALMLVEIALVRGKPWPLVLIWACVVVFLIVWENRYKRKWQQFRARNWPTADGVFVPGEGEVGNMMWGSSKRIAGYESRLYYEYRCDGAQYGIYRRFFSRKPDAEAFVKLLDGRRIPVRVKRKKPQKSYVLDRDVELLTGVSVEVTSPTHKPPAPG